MKNFNYIFILAIAAIYGCRKPYNPVIAGSPASYLVVEGVINSGSDSTVINLSRTVNLTSLVTRNPQTKATVTVESDQNVSYALTEITPGKYISPGLNLDVARQYRLRIKTPDNQQYLSDFVPVKITPPIDSIGFNIDNVRVGVQVYANAHDPTNNTHYYRWDFSETWAFHSLYNSGYISNGKAIVPRTQAVYNCFASDASSTVDIASTTALSQDIVYQAPIALIPSTSEKIETRYSILLHQYALTADAYNFWLNLKKNTEELGSIFDAQPSTAVGNIHNISNPAELVVGYISACTVQTKRIFIANSQLPKTWLPLYPYQCGLDSFFFMPPPNKSAIIGLIQPGGPDIPVSDFTFRSPPGLEFSPGYLGSSPSCVDCTLRGTTTIPSFW